MLIVSKPLSEITEEAIVLLCKELGLVNTVRFVNQFSAGYGDYTKEKDQIFGTMTLEDMISKIKQNKMSQHK